MTDEAPITFNPFLKAEEEDGRPSVLNEYCKKALDRDDVECFWVCFRRSHRWLAKDMKLDASSDSIRLDELRKIFGWWKRRSFYSTVGVKEVMIRFLSCSAKDEIGVAVIDFDYAGIQRDLDKSINFHLEKDIEHLECGVNIKGEASCSTPCQNLIYDDSLSPYCLVRHIRELSLRRENYKYLPSMLEYYWQNGIDKNAVKFLRDGQFVTQYKCVSKYVRNYTMHKLTVGQISCYGKILRGGKSIRENSLCLYGC
ncbi:hypothetical protein BJX76DRAFT_64358 [Aspergillus varians]